MENGRSRPRSYEISYQDKKSQKINLDLSLRCGNGQDWQSPSQVFADKLQRISNAIGDCYTYHKEEKQELISQIQHMVDMEQAIAQNPKGERLIKFYEENMNFDFINDLTKDEAITRTKEAKSYVDKYEYYIKK